MNLDRNVLFDVTNIIGISTNSSSFNPLGYGITQRITFSIELSSVSGIYNSYLHVQTVDIVLRGPCNDTSLSNIWEVGNQVPSTVPYYGTNLRATLDNTNNKKITIDNGITTVDQFISRLYSSTSPLFNPVTETSPIEPTDIEVRWGNDKITVPIEEYNKVFEFTTAVTQYANIEVVFLKLTSSGYLQLSVACLTVR